MVKIIEEEEEEFETNRNRLHSSPPHNPSPLPSTTSSSSSHHHQNRHQSPPPDSASPLSPDQTFYGFSPKPSSPPTGTQHPPEPQQAPLAVSVPPTPAPMKDAVVVSRLIRDEPSALVTKTESGPATGFADEGGTPDGGAGGGEEKGGEGGPRSGRSSSLSVLRRARNEAMVRRVALGLRVCELMVCLVSFSVMAADKNRGWALDSFDRYKEFRYCISVNVIGFAYSGLQCCSLTYQLTNGEQISWGQFRSSIDFLVDQMLAYVLVSSSSSAATRVDDWILNWGKDRFPTMASASVGMSFLAFLAFALSSVISGYLLCTHR